MFIDTYQDLLYPDKTIEGFRGTSKTWNKIKNKVNFTDKKVLDIGCSTGYFMIQSLNMGASKCIGIDLNELHNTTKLPNNYRKPLEVAKELLELWKFHNNRYFLIEGDWENYNLEEKIDIIFCMNVVHYWKDLKNGLHKLFQLKPEIVIFEIDLTDIIKTIIDSFNYQIIFNEKSHWNGKDCIIIKRK
jgi:SAM-dependent methyltransferase